MSKFFKASTALSTTYGILIEFILPAPLSSRALNQSVFNSHPSFSAIKANLTRPIYAGRLEAASPATGSFSRHNKEQNDLVNDALELTTKKTSRHAAE